MPLERLLTSVPDPDPRESALARTINQSPLVARVLLARGFDDPDRARHFIRPDLSKLSDPYTFHQMDVAVQRIRTAVEKGESIVVHGDYDVDGITGTVLLLKFFSLMQVDVKPYIPKREDGYSFTDASARFIKEGGFNLCISVDNGTNAIRHVEQIQAAGCDVIVTDHHGTSDNVADAFAILNPRLPDSGYPDRDLAGVGVAFRLATAIAQSFSRTRAVGEEFQKFLVDAMAYVALGTVADVAPLGGENHTMVFHGLRALAVSANPGIRALLDCAGLTNRSPDAEDIAFRIAPLINAAGRMSHAIEAVDLLMATGYQEAQEKAKVIEQHNRKRRGVERELLDRVKAAATDHLDDKILVLGGEDWHPGVLGIVAARMAETYHRPTILVSFGEVTGRGSGRSPGGIHLREAMHACADCLESYGGHAAAAGLEVRKDRFDEFRTRINAVADQTMKPITPIAVDGLIELDELDPREVRRLDLLGPFGSANRRPVFLCQGVKIVGTPSVDQRGVDLRFRVVRDGLIMPARLRGGAPVLETLRGMRDPVTIIFSPRLSARSEDGPVELQIWRLERAAQNGNDTPLILP